MLVDEEEAALSLFHSNWKKGMLRPSPSKDAAVTINYLPKFCMSAALIRELSYFVTIRPALTFLDFFHSPLAGAAHRRTKILPRYDRNTSMDNIHV